MQNFYKHITNIKQLNEILIKYIESTENSYLKENSMLIREKFYIRNKQFM